MFRTAELGRTIAKDEYHEIVPGLRARLLEIQQQLRSASFPVIIVFGGVDGAGKSETINLLNEWLDPRWLITRAYGPPSDEMVERPEYWRYWRDLPPRGRIGLFLSCWYSRPLLDRVYGHITEEQFDDALDHIASFEKTIADDGALVIKFWMHLSKDKQKKRLKELQKNPLTRWRVSQADWDNWHLYDTFISAAERLIMRTSTGNATWRIVEGEDKRYRSVTVGQDVLDRVGHHIDHWQAVEKLHAEIKTRSKVDNGAVSTEDRTGQDAPAARRRPERESGARITILNALDMTKTVSKADYKLTLEEYQGKLNQACQHARHLGVSTILVFEGWDAAGKGGAIRRVTGALDARNYQVIPIAAPTDEERAHHYLWRFWRHLSRAGRLTVFDRSWYGRVLVERVENFASETEWRRAYAEINDFEDQLVRHGIVVCKFWLNITAEEQLERFKARENVPYKRWKLTEEDWRNRERWYAYEEAVNDMVERTSTMKVPWTLVEANCKRYARIKVLKTIFEAIAARISVAGDPPSAADGAAPYRQPPRSGG